MKKPIIVAVLLAVALTASVQAASGKGPTGLVNVPSADVLQSSSLEVAYHGGSRGSIALNVGLIPNLEVGVANLSLAQDSRFYGFAKYRVLKESSAAPSLAIGLVNDDYYMVASKLLDEVGVRGHVGVGTKTGVFAGVSKMINPVAIMGDDSRFAIPTLTVSGEYDGATFNFGLDLEFEPDICLKLSVHDMKDLGFGLGVKFGF